jgi:hypothetical protein
MGNTGYSQGQHLHFELRRGGYSKINYAVDPLGYLAIENKNLVVSDKTLFPDQIKYRQTTIGTPVARNSKVDQLHIVSEVLRARETPGTSGTVLGYATPGWYNVNGRTEMDGYKWFGIEDFWVAQDPERTWCNFFPKAEAKYEIDISGASAKQSSELVEFCKTNSLTYTIVEI